MKLNGVRVPHKKNTAGSPSLRLPIPETVTIPMSMHIGKPATVLVKRGDSVKVGDLDMAKDKNVDIHTPLDTTIVRVIASHNDVADDEDEEASDEA